MAVNQGSYSFRRFAAHPNVALVGALCLLAVSMLLASGFFLYKNTSYFDDSFIYLHMAANIVEQGTARYFPITGSALLLSSSPLRLLTLVPGFAVLQAFGIPLRTLDAAKFNFLCSGFIAFLCFVPFWGNRLKLYILTGVAFFLLGACLDTLFLMEGGVLYFSLLTLIKLLCERSDKYAVVGVAVLAVGLSRPEIGAAATLSTVLVYWKDRNALVRFFTGLVVAFVAYCLLMAALGVYPIPSTVWSKQVTGKLKLFSDKSLIQVLPTNIAQMMGLRHAWAGWLLIALPAALSLLLKRGAIPILAALAVLIVVAISMPGSFVWYSENFMIALFVLAVVVAIEIYRRNMAPLALVLSALLSIAFILTLFTNFAKDREYPWNDGSPGYLAYETVGKSAVGDGKFLLKQYSDTPIRVRMCEIGLVSYFSGPNSWIDDLCGLVQIGNLPGASKSLLRFIYPPSFGENGDDQLKRFQDNATTPVVDVWALRNKEEIEGAAAKCKFADRMFCINPYK